LKEGCAESEEWYFDGARNAMVFETLKRRIRKGLPVLLHDINGLQFSEAR
jgi:hypothetical protein